MKTGTPIAENRSASVCSVTVLPVPVAPRDQAVSIRKGREQRKVSAAGFRNDEGITHGATIPHPARPADSVGDGN